MFSIKYYKFSHIDQRNVKEGKGSSYRTKREALSHLHDNHFLDYRELDSRLTERKLPDVMYNPTMRCEAYITRV